MAVRFPSPPSIYDLAWANQYTRMLEQQFEQTSNSIQDLINFRVGATPPGTIVVWADGTPMPHVLTDLSSTTVKQIKDLYAIGNEIGVEYEQPHAYDGVLPVYCRVEGQDSASGRAHPANNWSGGVTRNPSTGAPSSAPNAYAWGGDPWPIEVIDEYNIRLVGSTWKQSPTDDDPVFINGYSYETIKDGFPAALTSALDWLAGRKGVMGIGVGWYSFMNGEVGVDLPSNVRVVCAGEYQTNFFEGDFFNQQMISFVGRDWEWTDCTFWGNRAFMGLGLHALRIGSEDASKPIVNGALRRVTVNNSSGYGINNGKITDKVNLILEQVSVHRPNNDFLDIKNKGKGNKFNWLLNFSGSSPGMGNVGTNRGMSVYVLDNNPITTVNDGRTTVQVRLKLKARINNTVWLSPATANGVSLSGWYRIIGAVDYVATIETGQTATSSGVGGGSGIQSKYFIREKGSTGFDLRGIGWTVQGVKIYGDLDQQIGVRTRGGDDDNANGPGGHLTVMTNIEVIDECTHPTSEMQGLILQSDDVVADGIVIKGRGGNSQGVSVGLTVGAESARAQIKNAVVRDCSIGYLCGGTQSNVQFDGYVNGRGFHVVGGSIGSKGNLSSTVPFEITATGADPTVTVTCELPHTFTGGETVTYAGAEVDPTITVDMNDTFTVGTIINTLSYTVTATGQNAGGTGIFGGPDVTFVASPVDVAASDNQVQARLFSCFERPALIASTATNTKIINSSAQNSALQPLDSSTTTIWGPGNTGEFPSNDQVVVIANGTATVNLVVGDSGKTYVWGDTTTVVVNLPDPNLNTARGFRVSFLSRAIGGAIAIKTPSGVIRSGTATTTGGGAYTSSTEGARAEVSCLFTDRYYAVPLIGTWTAT